MLVLAGWLSIGAAARASGFPLIGFIGLSPQISIWLFLLLSYAAYAMPFFLALAVYRLWRPHQVAPAIALPAAVSVAEAPNLWQPKRAAAIGAMIALAVLFWSLSTNSQMTIPLLLIGLGAYALPFFVPTFLIYAALVASVLRFGARRDAIAGAALLAALIPFGFWAASISSVLMAKARERAAIAAIPKVALPAKVGAVVIEGEDWSLINCARSRVLSGDYTVGDVLTHGQSKSPYLRFTRATAKSPVNKGEAADGAPTDYVLIRFPRRPQFLQDSRVPADIIAAVGNLRGRSGRYTPRRGDLYGV
jgi:hypothetical protein